MGEVFFLLTCPLMGDPFRPLHSDYAAEYHVSGEEAEKTLKNAELFVDEVKKVLAKEM